MNNIKFIKNENIVKYLQDLKENITSQLIYSDAYYNQYTEAEMDYIQDTYNYGYCEENEAFLDFENDEVIAENVNQLMTYIPVYDPELSLSCDIISTITEILFNSNVFHFQNQSILLHILMVCRENCDENEQHLLNYIDNMLSSTFEEGIEILVSDFNLSEELIRKYYFIEDNELLFDSLNKIKSTSEFKIFDEINDDKIPISNVLRNFDNYIKEVFNFFKNLDHSTIQIKENIIDFFKSNDLEIFVPNIYFEETDLVAYTPLIIEKVYLDAYLYLLKLKSVNLVTYDDLMALGYLQEALQSRNFSSKFNLSSPLTEIIIDAYIKSININLNNENKLSKNLIKKLKKQSIIPFTKVMEEI